VHDWFAFGIWLSVIGHVAFALSDGDSLRSMVQGSIPTRWARQRRPRWYDELVADDEHAPVQNASGADQVAG